MHTERASRVQVPRNRLYKAMLEAGTYERYYGLAGVALQKSQHRIVLYEGQ